MQHGQDLLGESAVIAFLDTVMRSSNLFVTESTSERQILGCADSEMHQILFNPHEVYQSRSRRSLNLMGGNALEVMRDRTTI